MTGIEMPFYVDMDKTFEDAAKKTPAAAKPLEVQVENVAKRINNSIAKMQKATSKPLEGVDVADLNAKMTKYANTTRLAAQQMMKLGMEQGKVTAGTINIRALSSELSVLAAKWNSMKLGSKFDADGKLRVRAQELIDRMSRLTAKTIQFGDALKASSAKANASSKEAAAGINSVNASLSKQGGVLSKINGYLSAYTLLFSGLRFIRNIRETTAEFEMQKVALGGIINDMEQAKLLFRQIKAAAIESPFQIKDLVTYTKQLSAYRVETENLFNITMRLADVSAGLGVDMNRLVLAYGQVRAASVLRGQELRQFTEAGIPLVDLLAKKFTELNGKMVSTADVFELISKRAVPFEMIAEVFNDMTDAGGVFYKMQEKQAETLAGQWSNLKDALSIMYDEIGNTDAVHGAMEGLISDAKFLMQNWRAVAQILKSVAVSYGAVKVASLYIPNLTKQIKTLEAAEYASLRAKQLQAAQEVKNNALRGISIKMLRAYSREMAKAAAAQTLLGRGWHKIAATMLGGGWIGIAATAAAALVGWLTHAWKESRRLGEELEKIGREGTDSINKSIYNFKRLADAAVNAADGSDKQNEAIAELQRSYGDLIPSENLQIKKLKELEGNYDFLTAAIRQKINMQTKEQELNAVTDYFSSKIQNKQKKARGLLAQYGLDKDQINAVLNEIQNLVDDGTISMESSIGERAIAVEDVIKRLTGVAVDLGSGFRDYDGVWHDVRENNKKTEKTVTDLIGVFLDLKKESDGIENDMSDQIGMMGIYANKWDELKKEIESVSVAEDEFGDRQTFTYKKEKIRREVEKMAEAIERAFDEIGIDISGAISPEGKIDFDAINRAARESNQWGLQSYIKHIQDAYESVVPTNQMVDVVEKKFLELSSKIGISMDKIQGYLLRGNKDTRTYVKDLKDELQEAEDKVNELNLIFAAKGAMTLYDAETLKEWEDRVTVLKELIVYLEEFDKKTKNGKDAYVQDPFINNMKERIKFMQDFQKGYDDLNKYLMSDKAIDKTLGYLKERGMSLGLGEAEQKRAAKDLSQWYDDMLKKSFNYLKSEKGVTGTMTEFLSMQITGNTNRDKMLKDFQAMMQALFDAKTDYDVSEQKKNIEDALKRLKDQVKQSEEARNFYKDILGLTGDEDLAANLSVSVYGDVGREFKDRVEKTLSDAFKNFDTSDFLLWDKMRVAIERQEWGFILDNIKGFGEKWGDIVKHVAEDTIKYNASIAKGYAKLLLEYDEIQRKRVDIENQSADKIKTIEEGLQLELSGLRAKGASSAAIQSAKARAAMAKDAVSRETNIQLSRLESKYRLFFDSVGVISIESARKVAEQQKKMLSDQFARGQITLSKYKKELKEIDEQLKKYNTNDKVEMLLSGKWSQFITEQLINAADGLRAMSSTMQTADGFWTPGEESKSFLERVNKILNFGNLASIFSGKKKIKIQDEVNKASRRAYINAIVRGLGEEQATYEANTAGAAVAAEYAAQMEGASSQFAEGVASFLAVIKLFGSFGKAFLKIIDEDFRSTGKADTGEGEVKISLEGGGSLDTGITSREFLTALANLDDGIGQILSGNVYEGFTTIAEGFSGITAKVNSVNQYLEVQADYLKDLQYEYSRLENAMSKSFGSEYISNYNQEIEALRAQAESYRKQAELERSKGKKADEFKARDYERSARQVEDSIDDISSKLSEFFTDMDVTSAAKDFAQAWIDAYQEFGSTTDAMKEKFNDMVENMVVNSLAAQLVQGILKPIFEQIDDAAKDGALTAEEIASISALVPDAMAQIDAGMTGLMNQLTAAGVNLRQQAGSFTGISRDIASASEESVTGLAAGINTQNFYIQHIDQNVALILSVLTGGSTTAQASVTGQVADPYKDQMLQYAALMPDMHDDIHNIYLLLNGVIRARGEQTTKVVHTNL